MLMKRGQELEAAAKAAEKPVPQFLWSQLFLLPVGISIEAVVLF